jgi:hypothetical protein
MTTLNKSYTRIAGTDAVNTIDNTNNTPLTQIEADMTTIETNLTRLDATSGSNTGDQSLTGLVATTRKVNNKALSSDVTLTTADIADSTDARYCTDAQKTAIGTIATPTDATVAFTDITTNDSSVSKHGFLKKLSGTAGQYMDGSGAWSVPTSGTGNTLSPATTTDGKIPQWNGSNSNTLKNGLLLDTDGTMAGDLDTSVPSQKAVVTYVNHNPYKFYVWRNAAANTGNAAFAVIAFDTEVYDTGNNVAAGVFTVPVTGYYQMNFRVGQVNASATLFIASLFVNGSDTLRGPDLRYTGAGGGSGGALLKLTAADTVDIRAYANATSALDVGQVGTVCFSGYLVSLT